jgi:hypothetical protein
VEESTQLLQTRKTHLGVEQPGAKLDGSVNEHFHWSTRGGGAGQAEAVRQLLPAQAAACKGEEVARAASVACIGREKADFP